MKHFSFQTFRKLRTLLSVGNSFRTILRALDNNDREELLNTIKFLRIRDGLSTSEILYDQIDHLWLMRKKPLREILEEWEVANNTGVSKISAATGIGLGNLLQTGIKSSVDK